MTVVWSPDAAADLQAIRNFIRGDAPGRARSFITELVKVGEKLAGMPRAFPLAAGLEHKHIRRRLHGRYLIFYRIERGPDGDEQVEILHVVHAARDYVQGLFDFL
jgi:toxin ParE1/3/4